MRHVIFEHFSVQLVRVSKVKLESKEGKTRQKRHSVRSRTDDLSHTRRRYRNSTPPNEVCKNEKKLVASL